MQRVPEGEVSPYLVDLFSPGDAVEIRGPLGGWFVWRPTDGAPVLLVAGGAGIVPLMAMVRTRHTEGSRVPFRLVVSVRSPGVRYYEAELNRLQQGDDGLDVTYIFTRSAPVELVAGILVARGYDPGRIKTERFGPSGG